MAEVYWCLFPYPVIFSVDETPQESVHKHDESTGIILFETGLC